MSGIRWRARGGGIAGQTLPLVVVFMMSLLLVAGFTIDIGNAYRVKQSLQASADAASAAGAGNLPSPGAAIAAADSFGSQPGGKNRIPGSGPVSLQAVANCVTGPKFCNPANTVQVTEQADVPTYFLHLIGVDHVTVTVHSQSCSPCGALPLDIVMVLDRTGSMAGQKLVNAKQGVTSFLDDLDPAIDNVGLVVLPPAASVGTRCSSAPTSNYNLTNAAYLVVPLSNDYASSQGNLNTSSNLISTLNCVQAGGQTAYANALDAAQGELDANGRPGVQKVIIFLSDGAANMGPGYLPATSPYRTNPCGRSVQIASAARAAKTLIYSIAYDLDVSGAEACYAAPGANVGGTIAGNQNTPEVPFIKANQAMTQIATPGNYFYQPQPTQLVGVFDAITADLAKGTSRING